MTTPPPARPAVRYVWPSRVLLVAAGVCAIIAALCFGGVFTGTSPMAWLAGGVAAYFLAWAVP